MKKLVFGLLVAVSLGLSVGCAFATVDISQTHWKLPDRGFSGGSRVYAASFGVCHPSTLRG